MEDDKLKILNMVKEGKITVDEALKLIEALDDAEEAEAGELPQTRARWLRIRVVDLAKNQPKVVVNLPMGLVDWALRAGGKIAAIGGADLASMGINLDELRNAISYGIKGKIVDVVDEESKEHVEIVIE